MPSPFGVEALQLGKGLELAEREGVLGRCSWVDSIGSGFSDRRGHFQELRLRRLYAAAGSIAGKSSSHCNSRFPSEWLIVFFARENCSHDSTCGPPRTRKEDGIIT